MGFSVEELHIEMISPSPALFEKVRGESLMKTPEKIKAVLGEIPLPEPSDEKPYLYGCMVLSFDGKMGFADDPEGTLISKMNLFDRKGADLDFWIMNVCRTFADGVIFGTGTLKARMHKLWYAQIFDPDLMEARRELGKKTEVPLSLIISGDGRDIPFEHATFSMDPAPLILTSLDGASYIKETLERPCRVITKPEDLLCVSSDIRILASGDKVADTDGLLALLRASGLKHVSVEAPGYIWLLIKKERLDEYFLNYSGVYAGGTTAPGCALPFGANDHPHAALLRAGFTEGFVFTRQKLIYTLPNGGNS